MLFSVAQGSSRLHLCQLVCIPPVGILNLVRGYVYLNINLSLFALVLESPDGEWPIKYTYIRIFINSSSHIIRGWDDFANFGYLIEFVAVWSSDLFEIILYFYLSQTRYPFQVFSFPF